MSTSVPFLLGHRLPRRRLRWIVLVLLIGILVVAGRVSLASSAAALVVGQDAHPNVRIAFLRDGDVWVFDSATDSTTRLTTDGQARSPWWTTDGQMLFFSDHLVTGESGQKDRWHPGDPVEPISAGIWSPSGTKVARSQNVAGKDDATTVWVEAKGRQVRVTPFEPGFQWFPLAWSADGRRLALERREISPPPTAGLPITSTKATLWVTDGNVFDGQHRQLPLPSSFGGQPGWPDVAIWSPRGRFLTVGVGPNSPCASCRADGLLYYTVPVDGGAPVSLDSSIEGGISWAPTGSFVVLSTPLGRATYAHKQLKRFDPATGARIDLSRDLNWSDIEPAPSPMDSAIMDPSTGIRSSRSEGAEVDRIVAQFDKIRALT